VSGLRNRILRWRLLAAAWRDRRKLRALARRHPGLDIHPDASSAFASAAFHLEPGAKVRIGARVATERRPEGVRISVRAGGELVIGEDTWLRSDLAPVILYVYEGARVEVGPDGFLNGCQLSAKQGIQLGRGVWLGPGSRVWDSDQHAIDEHRPEQSAAVQIGDHVWVASDVTVLRGVEIGESTVVGTRSLVTRSLPARCIAYGVPARPHGEVGDRSNIPI
jgi:acetyltransferase-like isoleucine patch superfamily enzyme